MNLEPRKVFHVSVHFNKLLFMISLFILVLRFLQFQHLSFPFSSIYCCFFFSRVILDKFSMGHFGQFHISKGTTNAVDIFTSLNFYWFYVCALSICLLFTCAPLSPCTLSTLLCRSWLWAKRFPVQHFIMASEKDTLGVRAASKWQQQFRFVLYLIPPVQQVSVYICVCVGTESYGKGVAGGRVLACGWL